MSLIVPSAKVSIDSLGDKTILSFVSTARETSRLWRSVAISSDGTKMVAVATSEQIYTSTDSGVTWTPRESPRNWLGVASSSDGSKLAAVVFGGQIYTSTDSGATWTPRESTRNWRKIASSSNGTYLAAIVNGGQIYTSIDSGATWTPRESSRNWVDIASSADGSKLLAAVNSGQLYTSTNFGSTWTARESTRGWYVVACNANGTKMVAAVSGGQIYTSTNSGVNWVARGPSLTWFGLTSSSDGRVLAAAASVDQIYTSTNSGVTWTARGLSRNWFGIASNSDGSKLIACALTNQIYTIDFSFRSVVNINSPTISVTSTDIDDLNSVSIDASTFSATSYMETTNMSTLYIRGAPSIDGNILYTNSYAVNIADGSLAFTSPGGTSNGIQMITTNIYNPNTSATITPHRILLNDNPIYIRNDANHFLCYGNISGVTYSSGTTVDGPALIGFGGGLLGSSSSSLKWAMRWDGSQNSIFNGLTYCNNSTSYVMTRAYKGSSTASGGTVTFQLQKDLGGGTFGATNDKGGTYAVTMSLQSADFGTPRGFWHGIVELSAFDTTGKAERYTIVSNNISSSSVDPAGLLTIVVTQSTNATYEFTQMQVCY